MPRPCFKDWTAKELKDIFDVEDSNDITAEMLDEAKKHMQRKVYNQKLQAVKVDESFKRALSHPKGVKQGALALLSKDVHELSKGTNLEGYINGVRGGFHSELNEMMMALSPKLRTNISAMFHGSYVPKDKLKMMRDMVKEIFGEGTNNTDAKIFAASWNKLNKKNLSRFNRAGGDIVELEDWHLPQRHNSGLIAKASEEEWVGDVWDKINVEKMLKDNDIESEVELRNILSETYKDLATDGIYSMDPKVIQMNPTLANKHKKKRFLTFKDGDSWMDYQEKYGNPNIYASMMDHIDITARDIGLMELFGPNPHMTIDSVSNLMKKNDVSQGAINTFNELYDLLSSRNAANMSNFSSGLATYRNIAVASKLGSALLSAATDSVGLPLQSAYNGFSGFKTLTRAISNLARGKNAQQEAASMGMVADYAMDAALSMNDYSKNLGGTRSVNAAESVMKASGLNAWTNSLRAAFHMEFVQGLTKAADSGKLNNRMAKALKRYGIDDAMWERIAKSKRSKNNIIDVQNLEFRDQATLLGMINGETSMAVPTPDARARNAAAFGSKANSFNGEVIRSVMQFQSFNVSMFMNQWGRIAHGDMTKGGRAAYAAAFAGGLTAMGVVSSVLKDIASGKEPQDFTDPKLWVRGFQTSGALPFLGDFLLSDYTTGYQSAPSDLTRGPVIGAADDMLKLVVSAPKDWPEGDFSKVTDIAIDHVPFQNLWWSKLVTDRFLADHLRKMSDPNYDKKNRARVNRMNRKTGQQYWWRPAETSPE